MSASMSPADAVMVMRRLEDLAFEAGAEEGPEGNEPAYRLWQQSAEARTAVAALIERESALETDLARVSEELGLPPNIGPAPGVIRALVARNAELEAERDALRKACVAVLDSSPKNICHRNAKEREAYKAMRRALGWPEGRHGH